MPEALKIDQAPASLLGEKEKPPAPAPLAVNPAAATPSTTSGDPFDEQWVKAFVSYCASIAYEATDVEAMKLTSFELAMLTPLLTRFLNRTAPAMLARAFPGLVADDDPTMPLLALVLLLLAVRRILAIRRHRREKGKQAPKAPPSTQQPPSPPDLRVVGPEAPAGASTEASPGPGGMSGQLTGGHVGDGRIM